VTQYLFKLCPLERTAPSDGQRDKQTKNRFYHL